MNAFLKLSWTVCSTRAGDFGSSNAAVTLGIFAIFALVGQTIRPALVARP
jgi:hypothetical protein